VKDKKDVTDEPHVKEKKHVSNCTTTREGQEAREQLHCCNCASSGNLLIYNTSCTAFSRPFFFDWAFYRMGQPRDLWVEKFCFAPVNPT
jgi:hypothetical protein